MTPDWDPKHLKDLDRGSRRHFWLHSLDGAALLTIIFLILFISFIGCN